MTAELFLDTDFSLATLKLLALLSSLLKLLTLLRDGLATWRLRRGEDRGIGECIRRGDGDLVGDVGRRSYGLRDRGGDPAGVESGDNSSISQNCKRMSGVDCLLLPSMI